MLAVCSGPCWVGSSGVLTPRHGPLASLETAPEPVAPLWAERLAGFCPGYWLSSSGHCQPLGPECLSFSFLCGGLGNKTHLTARTSDAQMCSPQHRHHTEDHQLGPAPATTARFTQRNSTPRPLQDRLNALRLKTDTLMQPRQADPEQGQAQCTGCPGVTPAAFLRPATVQVPQSEKAVSRGGCHASEFRQAPPF